MSSNHPESDMSSAIPDIKSPVIVNNVLYNEDAVVGLWVHEQFATEGLDMVMEPGFVAFGIVDPSSTSTSLRERLIAGCYFFRHTDTPGKRDIWVCAAMTEAAMTHRAAIRQILQYPFTQLGLSRISAECDLTNLRLLRQLEILGFAQEGIKPHMDKSGRSFGYFGLYPQNCPFWSE